MELRVGVENWEVYDEWITFSRYDVLCDHLVFTWVRYLSKVAVRGKDVRLRLILSNFASIEGLNEVLL